MTVYESFIHSMNTESAKQTQPIRRTTISLPGELLERGTVRAKEENRSFSSYVQSLIDADAKKSAQPQPVEKAA